MVSTNWNVAPLQVNDEVKAIANQFHLKLGIAAILDYRKVNTVAKAKTFLKPSLDQFRDPFLLHDMQKAVDRIYRAVETGEKITVYGDYDADGITSTTIMYETLCIIGANVDYFIPNRFVDGYGPNPKRFRELIEGGTSLIITVDNGIVAMDSIALAKQLGADVIVTDHHEMGQTLPDADAIVYAKYPGDEYPFDDMSGAGIAFKVSCALLDTVPMELIGLAAMGTIGDVVSVTDENRVIVKFGLLQLRNTLRPGLKAMIRQSGIVDRPIFEDDIGFKLAPKFNALGRLGDAADGVKLLTNVDFETGLKLADWAELQNVKRKKLVAETTDAAMAIAEQKIKQGYHTLVVSGDNWHQGLVGIVASRLVDKFNCPTIVLAHNVLADTYHGSGRSVAGFDLFKALDNNRDHMDSFGGHAMACGLGVSGSDVKHLQNHLEAAYKKQTGGKVLAKQIDVTTKLKPASITRNLYDEFQQMAPFGTNNPKPLIEVDNLAVTDVQILGRDKQTLKIMVSTGMGEVPMMKFHGGDEVDVLSAANHLDVVVTMNLNYWNGRSSLQLMLEDYRVVD